MELCRNADYTPLWIETSEEQDYLFSLIADRSDMFGRLILIGGKRLGDYWYWEKSNGSIRISYQMHWQSGEPNNKNEIETCLSIGKGIKGAVGFNDVDCDMSVTKRLAFLCQRLVF